MVPVGKALAAYAVVLVALLGGIGTVVGLDAAAWLVGLACGLVLGLAVARGSSRAGRETLGPADCVTLGRGVLACVLAALVAESFVGRPPVSLLVGLAVLALLSDSVDGTVARRTRTGSGFGARFDGEADAFLLLVLSVYVARSYGAWVVAIGVARYAFAAAGWVLPRLCAALPFRYWRKVVTATQGIVLTVAAAEVVPRGATYVVLVAALALLAESFGRDVVWAWRHGVDDREAYDRALERARRSAYAPGEFVGQESFMSAGEILALAERAGVGPGVSVLDLCCGVAAPGRFITSALGCAYLGVDSSPAAVALARQRAGDLPCRFEVIRVPPLPHGRFDVVLLLETMLAFDDKEALLRQVAAALAPGGRFAFTVEEGEPLTGVERRAMPHADTVWPVPLAELLACLRRAGLQVRSIEECSPAHRATAEALTAAFARDRAELTARLGRRATEDLLSAHRLWADWLGTGRVRKLAIVAESASGSGDRSQHHATVRRAHLDRPDLV